MSLLDPAVSAVDIFLHCISILPNLLLYFLSRRKSNHLHFEYRLGMKIYSLSAIFYAILHCIVVPALYAGPDGFLMYSRRDLPRSVVVPGITLIIGVHSFLLFVICVVYVDRWIRMHKIEVVQPLFVRLLNTKLARSFAAFVIFLMVFVLIVFTYVFCTPTPDKDAIFEMAFFLRYNVSISSYSYIGTPTYADWRSNMLLKLIVVCYLFFYSSILTTMTLSCYGTWRFLHHKKSQLKYTFLQDSQKVFILLCLQCPLTFIFSIFPVTACLLFALFSHHTGVITNYMSPFFALGQVFQPILIIVLVGEFSKTLRYWLYRLLKKQNFIKIQPVPSKISVIHLPASPMPSPTKS